MKRKIFSFIIDVALIAGVFAIVEILSQKVFHSESLWLDIGLYIAAYIVVFGIKRVIVTLWKRKTEKNNTEVLK